MQLFPHILPPPHRPETHASFALRALLPGAPSTPWLCAVQVPPAGAFSWRPGSVLVKATQAMVDGWQLAGMVQYNAWGQPAFLHRWAWPDQQTLPYATGNLAQPLSDGAA